MNTIYFEAKGEYLLEKIGMPKAEFARRMGIHRQNVKALFKSKDIRVIQKAAEVIGVPWEMLVGYVSAENVAVVRKNYRINGKKLETKNWILTAYHKEII